MKRVALVLACVVLVMASVGTVVADGGHVVHLPMVMANSAVMPTNPLIEYLLASSAAINLAAYDGGTDLPIVGRFSLECDDADAIASPDHFFRRPDSLVGSPDGRYSAMNPDAELPPYVYDENGQRVWITENPTLSPRLDTTETLAYIDARSACR
jgi:hypothetical protein